MNECDVCGNPCQENMRLCISCIKGGWKCLDCNNNAVPSCCWCLKHCGEHANETGHWPRKLQKVGSVE